MAAGDILIVEGTTIVFGGGGTPDVVWTPTNVADGAGRQTAQHDLGASPRTNLYRIRFYSQYQATPTLGASSELYLKTSDDPADHSDNDLGNGDLAYAAGDVDKLRNLTRIGDAIVDQAAAATEFVLSIPEYLINSRYINFVMWNATGATSSATAADIAIELTPITYQGQSA